MILASLQVNDGDGVVRNTTNWTNVDDSELQCSPYLAGATWRMAAQLLLGCVAYWRDLDRS